MLNPQIMICCRCIWKQSSHKLWWVLCFRIHIGWLVCWFLRLYVYCVCATCVKYMKLWLCPVYGNQSKKRLILFSFLLHLEMRKAVGWDRLASFTIQVIICPCFDFCCSLYQLIVFRWHPSGDLTKIHCKAWPPLEDFTPFHCSYQMNKHPFSLATFDSKSHQVTILNDTKRIKFFTGFTVQVQLIKNPCKMWKKNCWVYW